MRTMISGLLGIGLLLVPRLSLGQVACGDVVERATVALSADLDCTGHTGRAITLVHARLRLNGFTVRGAEGVQCAGACAVAGPGVVEGSTRSGIWSNTWWATRYRIKNVTVRDNAEWGIAGYLGATSGDSDISVKGSTIEDNGLSGIFGDRKVSVSGSIVRNNGSLNGGVGVLAMQGDLVIRSSTIEGNLGEGLFAWRNVNVTGSSVTGNLLGGIIAGYACVEPGRARVVNSTVTGNALGTCPAGECTDVASCVAPAVRATTCGTSHQIASGLPGNDWGECALD